MHTLNTYERNELIDIVTSLYVAAAEWATDIDLLEEDYLNAMAILGVDLQEGADDYQYDLFAEEDSN